MSLTLIVSKFDKSADIKDEQKIKTAFIFITFDVLKLDKFTEINFLQP